MLGAAVEKIEMLCSAMWFFLGKWEDMAKPIVMFANKRYLPYSQYLSNDNEASLP